MTDHHWGHDLTGLMNPKMREQLNKKHDAKTLVRTNLHATIEKDAALGPFLLSSSCHNISSLPEQMKS
jgi:hypothetical protein